MNLQGIFCSRMIAILCSSQNTFIEDGYDDFSLFSERRIFIFIIFLVVPIVGTCPIPLSLHHPLALLIIFDAHQLLIAHHRLNLPELRSIHHLSLQMLLDEFLQVTPPYLFVLFGNIRWTLLSVACQVNGSISRCQRKDLFLFHNVCF